MLPDTRFVPDYLDTAAASSLFDALMVRVDWQSDAVTVYGRTHPIPRLHQWYADAGLDYRWSGLTMEPRTWLPELQAMRDQLNNELDAGFNSVLANLYRNGNDSMGWHADDEAELGGQPVIASISLGATRDFDLRFTDAEAAIPDRRIPLTHGSLLLMQGNTQHQWKHALPKRKAVVAPRINLTFRRLAATR